MGNFLPEEEFITVRVHPLLVEELKIRKETIERETERKAKGGLTIFSELAALELKGIRHSGSEIMRELLKLKDIPVKKFDDEGVEKDFVPYEIFKTLYRFASVLSRKKDQNSIRMEITKIRGLKKNEVKLFW